MGKCSFKCNLFYLSRCQIEICSLNPIRALMSIPIKIDRQGPRKIEAKTRKINPAFVRI
jgi:hypothetical protein